MFSIKSVYITVQSGRYDQKCFMFCLVTIYINKCIYTVCRKLAQQKRLLLLLASYHLNAFLSSSIGHAWLELERDEMFYTEHDF